MKFIYDNNFLPTLEYPSGCTERKYDFENVPQAWRDYIAKAYDRGRKVEVDAARVRLSPVCDANEPNENFPSLSAGQSYKLKVEARDDQGKWIAGECSLAPTKIADCSDYDLKVRPRQWFAWSCPETGPRAIDAIPLTFNIERLRDAAEPIAGVKLQIVNDDAANQWGYYSLQSCVEQLERRINDALENCDKTRRQFEVVVEDFYFPCSSAELVRLQREYKKRLNDDRQALEVELRLVVSNDAAPAQPAQPQPAPPQPSVIAMFRRGGTPAQPAQPQPASPQPAPSESAATFKMCFMPQDQVAGIIALDLGFSASTVAMWHPSFTADSDTPNSKAQLADYQEKLRLFFKTARPFEEDGAVGTEYWDKFCVKLAMNLGLDGDNMSGDEARKKIVGKLQMSDVQNDAYKDFYSFLRTMEITLYAQMPTDDQDNESVEYQCLRRRLSEIYRDALKVFAFERHAIKLPDFDGNNQLASEFRLLDFEFLPQGEMGAAVRNMRRNRDEPIFEEEQSNFYRFPKRKLASIYRNSKSREVFQGALTTLYKQALSEFYNDPAFSADERVNYAPQVIVLYPATLSGDARRELKQIAREMGAASVNTKYDESVAPLIFYLTKLLGNFDEIGPEAFKAKCRRASYDGNAQEWFHNMLIVDVGMGTTDVSLVRLKMTEQEPTNGRGWGGRVYKFEPCLLGAMGYEDVSGNTFTKKIYETLKKMIAEGLQPNCLDGLTVDAQRQAKIEGIVQTGFFNERDPNRRRAAAKRFSFLWDWAEEIKINFSKKYLADAAAVGDINLQTEFPVEYGNLATYFPNSQGLNLDLRFAKEDFEKAQNAVVELIEKNARELAVVALTQAFQNAPNQACNRSFDGVDTIVLSGRSSKLPAVKRAFEEAVDKYCVSSDAAKRPFAHPFTEITFESKYAKTATVAGALLAERMFQEAWADTEETKIEHGGCGKDVDVDNLFFNVSADFDANAQNIFKLQDELHFCDFTRTPRRLSGNFSGAQNQVHVARKIGGTGRQNVAQLNVNRWQSLLNAADPGATILVQYEITHDLALRALLVRRNDGAAPNIVYTDRLEGLAEPVVIPIPADKQAFVKDADGRIALARDITWGDQQSGAQPLFQKGAVLEHSFKTSYKEDQRLNGLARCCFDGERLAARTNARQLFFSLGPVAGGHGRDPLSAFDLNNLRIDKGILDFILKNQNSPNPRYPLRMTLAADANGGAGALILYVGDEHPPYWETSDFNEWLKPENRDRVCRIHINNKNAPTNVNDPFNGTL